MIDSILKNFYHSRFENYAEIVKKVATTVSAERASECGYDLIMGLANGNVDKRAKAWEHYIDSYKKDSEGPFEEEYRDGIWVPAIWIEL